MRPASDELLERLCRTMHYAYESAAAMEGWETQIASRTTWEEVPDANKRTMRQAVQALLDELDKIGTVELGNAENDG